MNRKVSKNGFTLLEALGVLVVISVMMVGLYNLWYRSSMKVQEAQAAQHMQQVADAADRYVKDHFAAILAASTAAAGPQYTIDSLIAEDFLPDGFSETNIWGQDYVIYVRSPRANTLNTYIITYNGREYEADGADSWATVTVPAAAMLIDGAGGFVPAPVNGESDDFLVGAAGGYRINLATVGIPEPGAGHLGYYSTFDESNIGSDFLYRNEVPGHPEYNQMNADLDMTRHVIEQAGGVRFIDRNVTAGTTCAAADEGLLFLDDTQGMYLCRNGQLVLMADTGNSSFLKSATIASHNTKINKPNCGAATGKTPQIFVGPVMFSSGASSPAITAVQAYATNYSDTQWNIQLRVQNTDGNWVTPAAGFGQTMVFAICN